MPANDFYLMTLGELFDALEGFNELEEQRREWNLWGMRKQIAFTCWVNGNKEIKEEDIFYLNIDNDIRKARIQGMEEIKVTTIS